VHSYFGVKLAQMERLELGVNVMTIVADRNWNGGGMLFGEGRLDDLDTATIESDCV
jgi:hypothetical protein